MRRAAKLTALKIASIGIAGVGVAGIGIAGMAIATASPLPAQAATPRTPAVYTPKVGSAERNALLAALRTDPVARFTFTQLRVRHSGNRAIAYAEGDNGITGGFRMLLVKQKGQSWRSVWVEGDGGSNSCADGARHYRWAMNLIRTYGIAPDALMPGITAETQKLEQQAKVDPEIHCVGEIEGGPARTS